MSWCDPRLAVSLTRWEDISTLMTLADKYDMPDVLRGLAQHLQTPSSSIVSQRPVAAYAVAIRVKDRALAVLAARHAVRLGAKNWPEEQELKNIDALAYHHLLTYYFDCGKLAANLFRYNNGYSILIHRKTRNWLPKKPIWESCTYDKDRLVHSKDCILEGEWPAYVAAIAANVEIYPAGATVLDMGISRTVDISEEPPMRACSQCWQTCQDDLARIRAEIARDPAE